jgi:hypothetical protein
LGVTGLYPVDNLVGNIPRHWILEFYGEEKAVSSILHYVTAYRSRFGKVLVLLNKDFGGLDPYMVARLARILEGDSLKIDVSRGFRFSDTVEMLGEAAGGYGGYESVIIAYPYYHMPRGFKGYSMATLVTGLTRRLVSSGRRVFLFNTVSRVGRWMPEGGNYHHHSVHVIVRVGRLKGNRIGARIVKHPSRPPGGMVSFRLDEIGFSVYQKPLTAWL